MSKENLKEMLSRIEFTNTKFSLDRDFAGLDGILTPLKIDGEQRELFKSILLTLCCASAAKSELQEILKGAQKNADLSSALLVDIDTRYELLLSHSEWLIENQELGNEFDLKLRSGARLSEEFFSELIYKITKAQRTLSTELGVGDDKLKKSKLPTLVRNLNSVNDSLSELLGRLPGRYDPLAASLLGV